MTVVAATGKVDAIQAARQWLGVETKYVNVTIKVGGQWAVPSGSRARSEAMALF